MRTILVLTLAFLGFGHLSNGAQRLAQASSETWEDSLYLKKVVGKRNAVNLSIPVSESGKMSVISNLSETIHFYIFDLDGTMMFQAVLKGKEQKALQHLQKGIYTYDVFVNDTSVEEGNIIVK